MAAGPNRGIEVDLPPPGRQNQTMAWEFQLTLRPEGDEPLYQRVAAGITAEIRSGRLRPGTVLPGTRRLAAMLGVHRNTTIAAYQELLTAGWIDTRPGRGTFVLGEARTGAAAPRRPHPATPTRSDLLAFGHLPEPTAAPQIALARAYRRALRRTGASVLDYAQRNEPGPSHGDPSLRAALAEMATRARGMIVRAEDVLVTSGSQMALFLAARTLIEPGDAIAVESRGYRPLWDTFRAAGATLLPIPIDAQGLRVDVLRTLAARQRVRAVYVTPRHQHPTGVCMPAARRSELLAVAAATGMTVLEDDYDNDFEYGLEPALPLVTDDPSRSVVYVGSLAKVLAPGLRVGFAVAPPDLLARMATQRAAIDRHGDHAVQCAVAELLDDGELRRHQQRMRAMCLARRNALCEALVADLGDVLQFDRPARGTAIWARVGFGIDVDAWHLRALANGVSFAPERDFAFEDGPSRHARFGFAGLDVGKIPEAVHRLRLALSGPGGARRSAKAVPAKIAEADLSPAASPP
jgi:GntR family transcriptional regulator / MocR family aminotransferase